MPKGSKVLMADDDKMLIDMYKERLELAGYNVTIGHNGEEALAKTREAKPDIILLDIMMPKINGYEALASIKSDPQTKDIPVIMLSALMRDFNREKAVEAGADDYLIKSEAMPADVITKIEQVLTKYGKGAVAAPGTLAPNIPAPSATPPSGQTPSGDSVGTSPLGGALSMTATPTPAPVVPTPPPDLMTDDKEAENNKIVFEPAPSPNLGNQKMVDIKKPDEKNLTKPNDSNLDETPTAKFEMPPAMTPAKEAPVEDVPTVQLKKPIDQSFVPVSEPPKPKPIEDNPYESFAKASEEKESKDNTPKAKSPASLAMIIVLVILLTALINDLVIYFFVFLKK